MKKPARLAVFVSGGGTNLQALLDYFNGEGSEVARVELVVASRAGTGGERRARSADVATAIVDAREVGPEAAERKLLGALTEHEIDVVVLAGYLKLVPRSVVARYAGAMLNIHPALLPAFGGPGMYGSRVHEAVLASGARVSGATVHLVDEEYDRGRIVAQWPVPILASDTAETLAARVLRVEHMLLPTAVEALVLGHTASADVPLEAFDLIDAAAPNPDSVWRLAT